jgi:His-Xaa-Ser system protein (TIGR03982 family)
MVCLAYVIKDVVSPILAYQLYKDEYMALTLECGLAMDSNWYIEQQDDSKLLKSSEVQLFNCHDYDKLRKKMLIMGVTEEALSLLGLQALEIGQKPVSMIAESHKFRER